MLTPLGKLVFMGLLYVLTYDPVEIAKSREKAEREEQEIREKAKQGEKDALKKAEIIRQEVAERERKAEVEKLLEKMG